MAKSLHYLTSTNTILQLLTLYKSHAKTIISIIPYYVILKNQQAIIVTKTIIFQ